MVTPSASCVHWLKWEINDLPKAVHLKVTFYLEMICLYVLHGAAEAGWQATMVDRKEAAPLLDHRAVAGPVLTPNVNSEGLSTRPFVRGGACPPQWLPVFLAISVSPSPQTPLPLSINADHPGADVDAGVGELPDAEVIIIESLGLLAEVADHTCTRCSLLTGGCRPQAAAAAAARPSRSHRRPRRPRQRWHSGAGDGSAHQHAGVAVRHGWRHRRAAALAGIWSPTSSPAPPSLPLPPPPPPPLPPSPPEPFPPSPPVPSPPPPRPRSCCSLLCPGNWEMQSRTSSAPPFPLPRHLLPHRPSTPPHPSRPSRPRSRRRPLRPRRRRWRSKRRWRWAR